MMHLKEWINHPERLNHDSLYELRNMVARYPFFQTARLLYLKNLYLLHDPSFGRELRDMAVCVPDRTLLFRLIEGDRYQLKPLTKGEKRLKEAEEQGGEVDRTLLLIDNFLSNVDEDKEQEDMRPMEYAVDYMSMLASAQKPDREVEVQEETAPLTCAELIDEFIQKDQTPKEQPCAEEKDVTKEQAREELPKIEERKVDVEKANGKDDECFTETLAKIYIKQHRYDKAIEIIKKLSLNYPKKNAYFADQIRYLEKLNINAKSK